MRLFSIAIGLFLFATSAIAAAIPCAPDASEQAHKLLVFHMGEGFRDRMDFELPVEKASIKNPANPKQIFKVLQVDGTVSPHGRYRMRFIFYPSSGSCLLMGQEILELANL